MRRGKVNGKFKKKKCGAGSIGVLLSLALFLSLFSFTAEPVKAELYNQDISSSVIWNAGNRVGPLTVRGGTKEEPIVISVNGIVDVVGEITVAEGSYAMFCGGGTLRRGGSYIGNTATAMISFHNAGLRLENITVDGNYRKNEWAGALITNGTGGSKGTLNQASELILGQGAVLKNNASSGIGVDGGTVIVNGATISGMHGDSLSCSYVDLEFINGEISDNQPIPSYYGQGFGDFAAGMELYAMQRVVIRGGQFHGNVAGELNGGDISFSGINQSVEIIPSSDLQMEGTIDFGLSSTTIKIMEDEDHPIISVKANGAETETRTFTRSMGNINGLEIRVWENPLDNLQEQVSYDSGTYQVAATAGIGGGIAVDSSGNFRIAAQAGYAIDEILADGTSLPDVHGLSETRYRFAESTAGQHTLTAVFAHTLSIANPGNGEISVQRVIVPEDAGTESEPEDAGTESEPEDAGTESELEDVGAESDAPEQSVAEEAMEPVCSGGIVREGEILIVTAVPFDRYETEEIIVTGMEAVSEGEGRYRVTASMEEAAPSVAVSKFLSPIEQFQKKAEELQKSDFAYNGAYEEYLGGIWAYYNSLSSAERANADVVAGLEVLNAYQNAFDLYTYIYRIGKVTHDASCKSRISYARAAYDVLPRLARGLVSDEAYRILTDAEAAYHALDFVQVITVGNKLFASGKATVVYGSPAFSLNAVTSGNGKLYYASSNEKVAKVSADGMVSCTGVGQAVITVTAMDTYQYDKATAKVTLTVTKGTQSITIKPGSVASTFKLNASVTSGGGKLTYSSSSPSIATVDSAGKVTVKGAGKVTFTVKAAESALYKAASKTVTIDITAVKGKTYTVGNLKYKVTSAKTNGSGTVTVTGVKTKKATVTIGKTVKIGSHSYKITAIGTSAFKNNKKLTSVSVGANVKTIGTSAFYGCTKLKKATLGTRVTSIGAKAFYKCSKLTSMKIQSSVLKKVGTYAVKGAGKKLTVTCPKKKKTAYKKLFSTKTGFKKTMKIK